MAGFPLYTLNKFTTLLLNNNFTIVLVEQVTEPPNPQRKITEILSPGMNINVVDKKNNYLMVLYYEIVASQVIAGISGIDLTTGKSFVYEVGSLKEDPEFANDEVYRIMSIYNPCELIILSSENIKDHKKTELLRNLNLAKILVHYKWDTYEYIKSMGKLSYQVSVLEKAFINKRSSISIIENLDLEKINMGRIALCCNIQFAYEHNADIIKNLEVPSVLDNTRYLNIEYNSAIQLNILSLYPNDRPLMDILNRCATPFGARAFCDRLLRPIIDPEELNNRYDKIANMLEDKLFAKISRNLCNIKDLERIKRKMILNKFNPQDWYGFNVSFENILEILVDMILPEVTYTKTSPSCARSAAPIADRITEMMAYYNEKIDIELASKYNMNDIKSNIFKRGVYKEIDAIEDEFNNAYNVIVDIYNKINNITPDICKIEYNDKEGYFIAMTKKRYETIKKLEPVYINEFQIKTLATSTTIKMSNKDTIMASNTMDEKQSLIKTIVTTKYQTFVEDFITKYSDAIEEIIKYIIDIDITCCNAKNAFEFKYYRPEINLDHTSSQASHIDAKNMRHPIIERIDDSVPYVGNDVIISPEEHNGMLLYGINASGKSCFMKTVGLNIIMAQAGMFVPSHSMKFVPYRHIFTRISGLDNIYRGMSSFTVEMTELRNILQRCNKYSLVIGDEICCGTESTSALAIVAAGIDTLITKKSAFIFATHLHELTSLEIVKRNIGTYMQVKHVHITIDENNRIIYERVLQEGQGSSIYGIEVCKSLNMPCDFMKIAENIRKEIQGYDSQIVRSTGTKYNSEIYMGECGICKKKAEDVHHINYQCESDSNGYFNDFHKNIKHNLLPLCKECHMREHNGSLNIKGYKKTSEGIIVDYARDDVCKLYAKSEDNDSRSYEPASYEPASYEPVNYVDEVKQIDENISEEEYIKLSRYIKKGKIFWYMRQNKTNGYKKCLDKTKIIKKINKLINKTMTDITDKLCVKLYDPNM